ncbi:glycoside hydrolase family 99-like domain-containing protein [Pantoea ananatis]|uniref:glycoside hydrolase family 99-like domain-containing protein n=1 Tax=Pantoea ananas TaxID=553 RepID=UPI0039B96137
MANAAKPAAWARRWDGRNTDILIEQQHSDADDLAFIAHLATYLADPRYLRIDGKPLVLVYRPNLMRIRVVQPMVLAQLREAAPR